MKKNISIISKKQTYWLLGLLLIAITNIALASNVLSKYQRDDVSDHRVMETTTEVFKDGLIVSKTISTSNKQWEGLKGHSMFAVIVDSKGYRIWVTKPYKMTTVCGKRDFCQHRVTNVNQESAPAAIGKNASAIHIYHSSGNLSQDRQGQVDKAKKAIREAGDIAKEVKDAVLNVLK
jgi:hypothetical protein